MGTYRTLAELRNTTTEELLAGIVDALKVEDQLTAALIANAGITDKPQIKLNRLASVPTPAVVACGDSITSAAISGSAFTFDPFTYVQQWDVCQTGQNLYSTYTDVVEAEMKGAIKGLSEKIATDSFAGNGSTAINGMASLVGSSTAATTGGLELADLDLLIDNTKDKGANMAFVGTPAVVRAVTRELRQAAGGLDIMSLYDTTFRVPSYGGIPVLKSDYATASALYLVNLDTGYKLFFGQTDDLNVGVFSVQEIGALESSLAKRWRMYCHLFGVSVNPQGLSRLTGVA